VNFVRIAIQLKLKVTVTVGNVKLARNIGENIKVILRKKTTVISENNQYLRKAKYPLK